MLDHPSSAVLLGSPELALCAAVVVQIAALEPDLCITAAYGNFLPSSFLRLPRFGTLNIHPSLLPRYRGAAPVQRSLERGDRETGVSLLYSVRQMDAGPLLSQSRLALQVIVAHNPALINDA